MATTTTAPQHKAFYKQLYVQVLIGIVAGIVVGQLFPDFAVHLELVGTSFVNLIKMVIAPVIFCTVVTGIAGMKDMKGVGRVGGKALLYFEAVTTVALVIGLVVVNVVKPGAAVNANPADIDVSDSVNGLIEQGQSGPWYEVLFHIFPDSVVGAFARGDVLQVLFFAVIFAVALHKLGDVGRPIVQGVERLGQVFFAVIKVVMYAAPLGAFGAMAATIGKYGIGTLTSLGTLVLTFYATAALFVVVILGGIAARCGVNIFRLLRYLKEELLLVLGTSSSESALPGMMRKMERLGCPKEIVGLTVPAGYSFNLDGTAIYLTLAAIFVAQAQNVHLSLGQQLGVLAVLLLTSKGAAGVTGSGFIVLAATLSAVGTIPIAGIMLIFGVDKFMSECRALTNTVGNAVGTIVVARWEGRLDVNQARHELGTRRHANDEPATVPAPTAVGALATTNAVSYEAQRIPASAPLT